jgi:hypothetical protein
LNTHPNTAQTRDIIQNYLNCDSRHLSLPAYKGKNNNNKKKNNKKITMSSYAGAGNAAWRLLKPF